MDKHDQQGQADPTISVGKVYQRNQKVNFRVKNRNVKCNKVCLNYFAVVHCDSMPILERSMALGIAQCTGSHCGTEGPGAKALYNQNIVYTYSLLTRIVTNILSVDLNL